MLSALRYITASGSLGPNLSDSDGCFSILCFSFLHDVLWVPSGEGASLEKRDLQIDFGQILQFSSPTSGQDQCVIDCTIQSWLERLDCPINLIGPLQPCPRHYLHLQRPSLPEPEGEDIAPDILRKCLGCLLDRLRETVQS